MFITKAQNRQENTLKFKNKCDFKSTLSDVFLIQCIL